MKPVIFTLWRTNIKIIVNVIMITDVREFPKGEGTSLFMQNSKVVAVAENLIEVFKLLKEES